VIRLHLGFPAPSITDLRMPDNAPLAQLAEELGFDTLWHSNQRFYREMFVRMTSSAVATQRIGIGGAVAEPFAVHPVITAQTLATLDELSGGRATLAYGAGHSGFPMMGFKRSRTALAIREAYTIVKGLLAGEEVTYEGEVVSAHRARLEFQPERAPLLWVATRGDVTLRSAGEYADGVLIATYASPDGVDAAARIVREGAARVGRDPGSVRLMSRVDTCVHADPRLAYEGTRIMVARFLYSSYPDRNFVRREGLEVPDDIEAIIAKRDYSLVPEAAALLSDDFVQGVTWAGSPDMVAERIAAIHRRTGIEDFGLWALLAPGQTREQSLRLIGEEVAPRGRALVAA
jgi:5,10-methylenetetrahydromethanopterin reductase